MMVMAFVSKEPELTQGGVSNRDAVETSLCCLDCAMVNIPDKGNSLDEA